MKMKLRKCISLLLIVLLVGSLVACGGGGSEEQTADTGKASDNSMDFSGHELVFGVWGGTFAELAKEIYVEPFEKLTGAKITIEEYGDDVTAKVVAQKEQNIPGFDVISGCGALDQIAMMEKKDAVLKLDYSKLPNSEYLLDNAKFDSAIGQYVISTNLAWNKDVYGDNPPDTLQKFYDVKNYPGNRGMISFSPTGILEQALIADGVPKDQLYPLDVDRAFKVLDRIKPSVTKWWSSGAEIRQALADGEVDCGIFWGGSVLEGIMKNGMDNIGISHDGSFLIVDCMAITSTCQDPDLAYAFLNYCISGEAAAKWSQARFYAPTTSQANDLIPADLIQYFTASPQNIDKAFWCDLDYWKQNFETVSERYMTWIANN